MSYRLILNVSSPTDDRCDGLEFSTSNVRTREAIEFAMHDVTSNDGHWIPLRLSYYNGSAESTETVRGYQVTVVSSEFPDFTEEVSVCTDTLPNEIQFRWMNTVDNSYGSLLQTRHVGSGKCECYCGWEHSFQ